MPKRMNRNNMYRLLIFMKNFPVHSVLHSVLLRVPMSRFLTVNSYAPLKVQTGLIRLLGRPILFSREVNITGAASNLTLKSRHH